MKVNKRLQAHKKANNTINELYENSSFCLVIHYSCESFYNIKDGKTPRITSIAVRLFENGQTKSFSIHKIAELLNITFHEITHNYDLLEKKMLNDFFSFVKEHKDYKWVHWNMRNINYGFEALQHRASILNAIPFEIKDENKHDLSILLIDKYGEKYSGHPRFESILEMNNMSPNHWLNGADEAKAFDNQEYVKLHQSTLAKVGVISTILKQSAEGAFKTNSNWRDIYGINPQGIYEMIKNNWLFALIAFVLTLLLGAYIDKLI